MRSFDLETVLICRGLRMYMTSRIITNLHSDVVRPGDLYKSGSARTVRLPAHESSSTTPTTHCCLSSLPSTSPPLLGFSFLPQWCASCLPLIAAHNVPWNTHTHSHTAVPHASVHQRQNWMWWKVHMSTLDQLLTPSYELIVYQVSPISLFYLNFSSLSCWGVNCLSWQ